MINNPTVDVRELELLLHQEVVLAYRDLIRDTGASSGGAWKMSCVDLRVGSPTGVRMTNPNRRFCRPEKIEPLDVPWK